MADSTFIERVRVKNYKSVAGCDVRLGSLTFLVGPNGAGKSNFVDAIRFVSDSLRSSLDHAMRDRGGIHEVRRRSSGHPTHFGIGLDIRLTKSLRAYYAFEIGAKKPGGFAVSKELCRVWSTAAGAADGRMHVFFEVEEGQIVRKSESVMPAAAIDRLYLVNASGLSPFDVLFERLSRMGFYSLNPDKIRDVQPPDAGEILARDGSNIASVLGQMTRNDRETKRRIEEYLSHVVPGISGVDPRIIGPKETLEFRQKVAGSDRPRRFLGASMSDGTARALGILVALFQSASKNGKGVPFVGIEEPEVALHPAAAGVLFDALQDASDKTQILVTSHSPDLLNNESVGDGSLLAVVAEDGATKVGPIDDTSREALRRHLYTAGELLRLDQLAPDPDSASTGQAIFLFEKFGK